MSIFFEQQWHLGSICWWLLIINVCKCKGVIVKLNFRAMPASPFASNPSTQLPSIHPSVHPCTHFNSLIWSQIMVARKEGCVRLPAPATALTSFPSKNRSGATRSTWTKDLHVGLGLRTEAPPCLLCTGSKKKNRLVGKFYRLDEWLNSLANSSPHMTLESFAAHPRFLLASRAMAVEVVYPSDKVFGMRH